MANIQLNKKNEKIVRRNYSKVSGSAPLPNLVEIQTESYKQFLLDMKDPKEKHMASVELRQTDDVVVKRKRR